MNPNDISQLKCQTNRFIAAMFNAWMGQKDTVFWRDWATALKRLLPHPEVLPVMTYKEAIEYFITARPDSPMVKKGAILKQSDPNGYCVSQVFLSEANELICKSDGAPYGRKMLVQQLDTELLEAFQGQDLILVS